MNEWRNRNLKINLVVCQAIIKGYLLHLDAIEKDADSSIEEKRAEIAKIRGEITKVGTEIDILKKEINLLATYSVN